MALTEDNRRGTFRSTHVETNEAVLTVGRERYEVMILDESAGGFSVKTESADDLPINAEGELVSESGLRCPVIVKHCEPRGMYLRIGLQRTDTASFHDSALQKAFAPRSPSSLSPLALTGIVLLGVVIGVGSSASLRERIAKLPGVSRLLNGDAVRN
jgi:hypothetical protein